MKSGLLSAFLVAAFFFVQCQKSPLPVKPLPPDSRRITILYTNDEHGWMLPTETTGGAAGLMGLWREAEGYDEAGPYLILSGGDMWTGPAISTWFQGESMADVMNAMHYDAAAIGNHEFDFKIDVLRQRRAQSHFPFLSANIREKQSGALPDFATPWMVKQVNGVRVGVIGLTTTSTPWTTFPDHVADYQFTDYSAALDQTVPRVKADSAELLIVIAHVPYADAVALAPHARELGITAIGAGHDHHRESGIYNGVAVFESGCFLRAYARLDIDFDASADTVISLQVETRDNSGGVPDPQVAAVVTGWETQLDQQLGRVIGYVQQEIPRNSNRMYNMVTDSWFFTFPQADVSLTNRGGIRQSVPAGNISLATIVGLLPFENEILKLRLTGAQLVQCIKNDIIVGGMTTIGGYFLSSGQPVSPDSVYTVLTTDYLYARSDYPFSRFDPDPVNTAVHYRQPLIDWIESLNTSPSNPLDGYLDDTPRQ